MTTTRRGVPYQTNVREVSWKPDANDKERKISIDRKTVRRSVVLGEKVLVSVNCQIFYKKKDFDAYLIKKSKIDAQLDATKKEILTGDITSRYIFGEEVIDGMSDFDIQTDRITNKSNKEVFDLNSTLPYKDYL